MDFESVGLRAPHRPKYLTGLNTNRQLFVFVVPRKLSSFGNTFRDGGCELVKCVTQREVHGKRRRGRPNSNMTSHSGNIAWGKLVRGAALAADRHF